MPCNVFGPEDNYDLETSHFLPAILKKLKLIEQKKLNICIFGEMVSQKEK